MGVIAPAVALLACIVVVVVGFLLAPAGAGLLYGLLIGAIGCAAFWIVLVALITLWG